MIVLVIASCIFFICAVIIISYSLNQIQLLWFLRNQAIKTSRWFIHPQPVSFKRQSFWSLLVFDNEVIQPTQSPSVGSLTNGLCARCGVSGKFVKFPMYREGKQNCDCHVWAIKLPLCPAQISLRPFHSQFAPIQHSLLLYNSEE